jgi:hypothetical protein
MEEDMKCAWCDNEGKFEVAEGLFLCKVCTAEYWDFDEGDLYPDEDDDFNYDVMYEEGE